MSTPIDDGGPAFPHSVGNPGGYVVTVPGMSLRDYLAAAALHGMLANQNRDGEMLNYVQIAYKFADLALQVRKERKQ